MSPGVVLTLNLILVGHTKFSNHVPEQVLLLFIARRHRRAKVVQLGLGLLLLFTNFSDNLWQAVFDMCEQQLGQLACKHPTA